MYSGTVQLRCESNPRKWVAIYIVTIGCFLFFLVCIGNCKSIMCIPPPTVVYICKCAWALDNFTNLKADLRGRGEEEVIMLGHGTKQSCLE